MRSKGQYASQLIRPPFPPPDRPLPCTWNEREQCLRDASELFHLALDSAQLGTWDYDLNSGRLFWDQRCRQIFGVARDEAPRGEDFLSLIHPDDRDRVVRAARAATDSKSDGRYEIEYRVHWSDGSLHWVHSRGQTIFDSSKRRRQPVRFIGTVMEITERKRTEEALRQGEEALARREREARTLIENAPDIVVRFDREARYLLVNPATEKMTGFPRSKFLGKTIFEVDLPDAMARCLKEAVDRVFATRKPTLTEHEIPSPEGRKYLHCWLAPEFSSTGSLETVLVIGRDITPLKSMEDVLRQAKRAAEEASQAKSEFLRNMSHEIRTPMTVIMGAVEQLQEFPLTIDQKILLEMADDSAHRLLNLIDEILDVSRIEAGRLKILDEPFDLRNLLASTLERLSRRALKKALSLRLEIEPQVPEVVHGDANRLGQILANLVGNAIKFTERGEVVVTVRCRPGELIVSVRDTGIGIPRDQGEKLFDNFSQVDSSLTRRYGGSGLGLAICKGLAELMGGAIGVESEEGRGSTFTVTLPLFPAHLPES